MRLIRGLHNLCPAHRGSAVTIGNFDGLHRGHCAVLQRLNELAAARGLLTTVMTFEPTPQEYFAPPSAPPRLQRLRDKLVTLENLGVDQVICLRFNRKLAALSAQEFVERILVAGLAVRYLVVGDDFRFGAGRDGDFDYLCEAGRTHGFEVANTETFFAHSERVSSTRVREALAAGDLDTAVHLLGRPYRICGRVAAGQRRGRTIGFPTANIHLHRRLSPLRGVFAVRVYGLRDDGAVHGVANVGTRPTVDGSHWVLEVHLFDVDADLYGQYLDVEFCKRLRDEKKFASFDELKHQIQRDAEQARQFLTNECASE